MHVITTPMIIFWHVGSFWRVGFAAWTQGTEWSELEEPRKMEQNSKCVSFSLSANITVLIIICTLNKSSWTALTFTANPANMDVSI